MTKDELVWQIQKTEEAFSKAGLKDPVPLFRAPWGEVTRKMREVMRAEGYVDIMWTVRGLDTEPGLSSELVVARVLRLVRPGYIVVLHTRNAAAPKALPEIIRQLKADGYRFVTLGEALFTPEQRMPRYQQTSPLLGYLGSWHERPSPLETGGSISEAESPEAGVLVSFTGTTLELICAIGPKRGEILVTIDGETPEEVDLYSPAEYHRVTVFSKSDLADTSHTALVSWAGAKNPASSGYSIDVDALRVSGELTQAPKPAVFLLRRAITRLIASYSR
jgi:hypothetical protein